jgi:CubicO group peptidase (beta-lactamase class C family)
MTSQRVETPRYLKYLNKCAAEHLIPGGAISLVTRAGCKISAFGVTSYNSSARPVEMTDMYDLASLTKVISTTTACLKLIESGEFALGTPIKSILTEFSYSDVSVGQLLTHTSGMPGDDKRYRSCRSKDELLNFVFSLSPACPPGKKVIYSDFGYILLGLAVDRITGSLEHYCEQEIFIPLGMRDTVYNPTEKQRYQRCCPTEQTQDRGLIQGEVHDGKAWRMGGVSGNAGLFSTVQDLSVFVKMLMDCSDRCEPHVLSNSTLNLLKRCYTPFGEPRRTLGWVCDEASGAFGDYCLAPCIYHTGFTGTSIYVDYSRQCGVVLLTNRIHPSRENNSIFEIRRKAHNLALLDIDCRER